VTGKLDTLSSLSPAGKLELKVNTMPLSLTFPHACPLSYTYTHTHTHTHTHRERERKREREYVCVYPKERLLRGCGSFEKINTKGYKAVI
jgi:hypothetical protein